MPVTFRIDDPADPRVEPYRDVRERDLVGRRGGVIAEGEVVLRALLRAGRHRVASVLLAEKRAERLAPLLAGLPDEVPVYVASQAVMDTITGFHIHRGILALGERAPQSSAQALLNETGPRALVVALFGVGNHDNMGGVFRNAAAFGVEAVLLDPGCCDPLYRKAIRVSVGAALTVPFARLDGSHDALDLLARHGFEAIALSPSGAVPLSDLRRPAEGPCGRCAGVPARARRRRG